MPKRDNPLFRHTVLLLLPAPYYYYYYYILDFYFVVCYTSFLIYISLYIHIFIFNLLCHILPEIYLIHRHTSSCFQVYVRFFYLSCFYSHSFIYLYNISFSFHLSYTLFLPLSLSLSLSTHTHTIIIGLHGCFSPADGVCLLLLCMCVY